MHYQPVIYKAWLNEFKPDEKTIINAAASVASHDFIERNLTASKGGFFGSNKFDFDYEREKLARAEGLHLARLLPFKAHIEHVREAAAQAGDNRLVKGRKSPTAEKGVRERIEKQRRTLSMLSKHRRQGCGLVSNKGFDNHHVMAEADAPNVEKVGLLKHIPDFSPAQTKIHLQRRDWSQEYRVLQTFQPRPSDAPEQQAGDRFTEKLTGRAVTKIFEAGAYVSTCKEGFKTFGTLTFNEERRRRVLGQAEITAEGLPFCPLKEDKKGRLINPNTTMGAEVARFFDGVKKLYQRGVWLYETAKDENSGAEYCPITPIFTDSNSGAPYSKIETNFSAQDVTGYQRRWASTAERQDDFLYLWVAECPGDEETGTPNPHVHFLMQWNTEKNIFRAWAERIEALWGNGFCKLERIKKAEAASGYLIKAIGYAAKGKNANQGIIKGNRYNMARAARAPAWETLQTFEAENMAGIIKETAYKLEQWQKPLNRQIRKANAEKDRSIAALAIKKNQGEAATIAKLKNKITTLENQIKEATTIKKGAGLFATTTNRFALTFSESASGRTAESRVNRFLEWAAGARGWGMAAHDCEFDDIAKAAREKYEKQYQQFQDTKFYWRAVLMESLPPLVDEEEKERLKTAAMRDFQEYESIAV